MFPLGQSNFRKQKAHRERWAFQGLVALGRNHTRAFAGHFRGFPEKLLQLLLKTSPKTLKLISIWPFNQTHKKYSL
jgi:hypothetical protein